MGSDKTYIFDGGGSGGGLDIAALVSSMMGNKGMDPKEAYEKNIGTYGRFAEAVTIIDPRHQ